MRRQQAECRQSKRAQPRPAEAARLPTAAACGPATAGHSNSLTACCPHTQPLTLVHALIQRHRQAGAAVELRQIRGAGYWLLNVPQAGRCCRLAKLSKVRCAKEQAGGVGVKRKCYQSKTAIRVGEFAQAARPRNRPVAAADPLCPPPAPAPPAPVTSAGWRPPAAQPQGPPPAEWPAAPPRLQEGLPASRP